MSCGIKWRQRYCCWYRFNRTNNFWFELAANWRDYEYKNEKKEKRNSFLLLCKFNVSTQNLTSTLFNIFYSHFAFDYLSAEYSIKGADSFLKSANIFKYYSNTLKATKRNISDFSTGWVVLQWGHHNPCLRSWIKKK